MNLPHRSTPHARQVINQNVPKELCREELSHMDREEFPALVGAVREIAAGVSTWTVGKHV